jgi:hypothetical protein
MLEGIQAQAQQGGIDPHEIALIARLRRENPSLDIATIVDMAHRQLQDQQAQVQAQAQPGAPETQPGMAPSAGPPQQPGAGGAPPLNQLLAGLRQPTQQSPAEQQLAGAGAPGGQ